MERCICIHGHFYQPPRENPWLEEIEVQESAYPFHDWNERINAECYAANAVSRILDEQARIVRIVNNYAGMSFNFGPTLLAWLEHKSPETYRRIIEADELSRERFSGHGSAMSQVYNHMIMPLACARDKVTQVRWGVADFRKRFGREPEGMWLAETAVDIETLEVLSAHGVRFTVLAPHQAARTRRLGDGHWTDVKSNHVDSTMPYVQKLPSGREIVIFFYDGPISRAVAFERLLSSGVTFADRLAGAFPAERDGSCLVHIATDGETYGHHHRHGDMALAFALQHLDQLEHVRLTNYSEHLHRRPPTHEVEIIEDTSWSCVHGVERWRSDCGCNSGGRPGWSQAWRAPLREALDWLRDEMAPIFSDHAARLFRDPWEARDDYINVILDRSLPSLEAFFERQQTRSLDEAERIEALKLMELQRYLMLMYTSCGWFFDDLSGIETVQVIQYAGRAVQLAQELFGDSVEERFVERLALARSNVAEHADGRRIYERFVKPAAVDLVNVGTHYAISSLFEEYQGRERVFCYAVTAEDYRPLTAGRARLAIGRARVTSIITRESALLTFGVLHLGDHNIIGSVRPFRGEAAYGELARDISEAFSRADYAETIRRLDRHFGDHAYTVMSLFRDEQRKILDRILDSTLKEIEASHRRVFEHNVTLMRFLSGIGAPLPRALRTTAEYIIDIDLRHRFEDPELDPEEALEVFSDAAAWRLDLDAPGLAFHLQKTMEGVADDLARSPDDIALLERFERLAEVAREVPFEVNLWRVQNIYYSLLQEIYPEVRAAAGMDDAHARAWVERFGALGEKILVRVPE